MKLRHTLSLLLAALLLLIPASRADADLTYFQPILTNSMELSTADWTDESSGRSLLSVLMILDLSLELGRDDYFDSAQTSYVGISGDVIDLYIHGSAGTDYLIAYQPSIGYAAYQPRAYASDSVIYLALLESCDAVYTNNQLEMSAIASQLSAAWGE